MLTSLKRLTGLPVVWKDQKVGYVERAVADVCGRNLHGIVVRRGIGSARWSPAGSILMAGRQCVILRDRPVKMPESEPEPVCRAISSAGGYAGEISDVLIRGETLQIAALEVSQGPFYRLMGRCSYAPAWQVRKDGEQEEAVVPSLLSWTQLCTRFGEEEEQ